MLGTATIVTDTFYKIKIQVIKYIYVFFQYSVIAQYKTECIYFNYDLFWIVAQFNVAFNIIYNSKVIAYRQSEFDF